MTICKKLSLSVVSLEKKSLSPSHFSAWISILILKCVDHAAKVDHNVKHSPSPKWDHTNLRDEKQEITSQHASRPDCFLL